MVETIYSRLEREERTVGTMEVFRKRRKEKVDYETGESEYSETVKYGCCMYLFQHEMVKIAVLC